MGGPRSDGLYLNRDEGDPFKWLRFYDDGVVALVSTSPGPPRQVAQWLRREDPARTCVPWRRVDGDVTFHLSTRTPEWVPVGPTSAQRREVAREIDLAGPLDGDRLLLVRREAGAVDSAQHYAFYALSSDDFEGPRRRFPRIKSFASLADAGLSAASVARVKKARGLRRDDLYALSADEIVAVTGIARDEADALVRWRDGG